MCKSAAADSPPGGHEACMRQTPPSEDEHEVTALELDSFRAHDTLSLSVICGKNT